MQCGHFQSRNNLSVRFNEINCQVQCEECNMYKLGMHKEFAENLDELYGKGTADLLVIESKGMLKLYGWEYEEKIKHYNKVLIYFQ